MIPFRRAPAASRARDVVREVLGQALLAEGLAPGAPGVPPQTAPPEQLAAEVPQLLPQSAQLDAVRSAPAAPTKNERDGRRVEGQGKSDALVYTNNDLKRALSIKRGAV